jgi:hypothetical protein
MPELPPAPLLEPRKTRSDVGHVQYGDDVFCFHGRKDNTFVPRCEILPSAHAATAVFTLL